MKKVIALIVFISVLSLLLFSCGREHDAHRMLSEFVRAYGADGIIYSPQIPEGSDGYIFDGLINKIYIFHGIFPDNYAVFLNSRADVASECAVFVCTDADMTDMVEEMSLERVRLLASGDSRAFVKRSGNIVFYSTMPDRDRAEKIFNEIIR